MTLAPIVVILLLPGLSKQTLLVSSLAGFSVGTLLGDVLIHVLPTLFASSESHHDHDHEHDHGHHDHGHGSKSGHHHHGHHHDTESIWTAFYVFCGFVVFCALDKLLSGGGHHHHHHDHDDHDDHCHHDHATDKAKDSGASSSAKVGGDASGLRSRNAANPKSTDSHEHSSHHHDHGHHHSHAKKPTVFLIVLGNIAHTFSEGLTLALSHFASPVLGLSTTAALLLHELPHRLGDFGVLTKSGFSQFKIIGTLFLMSLGTWIGVGVAWLMVTGQIHLDPNDKLMPAVTAGSLLYTSAVSILPGLMADTTLVEFLFSVVSMLAGGYMMVWIALNE